jgi:transcriptional regulator with XRE-family HTH domain
VSGDEISPQQSRAARRLLNWSMVRLASRSNLTESAIRNFEESLRALSVDKLAAIRTALEAAGVEFMNGDQPGVRMRKGDGVIRATWDPPPER